MKHHDYIQLPKQIERRLFVKRLDRRAEAALNFLVALAIGCGLAALMVAWWSS